MRIIVLMMTGCNFKTIVEFVLLIYRETLLLTELNKDTQCMLKYHFTSKLLIIFRCTANVRIKVERNESRMSKINYVLYYCARQLSLQTLGML